MAKLIPYTPDRLKDYQEFARRNWPNSYQASENYINWLYQGNYKDFSLAVDEQQQIIGVIHKLRLTWNINGQKAAVPAIHNLIVDKDQRHGSGLFLITGSLQGEERVFISGVNPPLSKAYEMLRCQEVPVKFYRKIISIIPKKLKNIRAKPDEQTIRDITQTLQTRNQGIIAPDWDLKTVKWRFFDPIGPKHLAFTCPGTDGLADFLIISYGKRKGFNTARIIEASVTSQSNFNQLWNTAQKQLKQMGIALLLVFSADDRFIQHLPWKPIKSQTKVYIYHKNKKEIFYNLGLNASAGDYGFEGI